MEDIISQWDMELEKRSRAFMGHAIALADWDRAILANRHSLLTVEEQLRKVLLLLTTTQNCCCYCSCTCCMLITWSCLCYRFPVHLPHFCVAALCLLSGSVSNASLCVCPIPVLQPYASCQAVSRG